MGTSKDYSGQTGGAWTSSKRIATRLARQGPDDKLIRAYARSHVDALGSASQAATTAGTAVRAAARLGGILQGAAQRGWTAALTESGLARAIGQPAVSMVLLLADLLAGEGATLEDVAAREAIIDCLTEEFAGRTYDEVEATPLDAAKVLEIVIRFVARFVYHRALVLLSKSLNETDPARRQQIEGQLRNWAESTAKLELAGADVRQFDPIGAAGQALAEDLVLRAYSVFAG